MQAQGKTLTQEEIESIKKPILEKYEKEGAPLYSTARLWDDGIINPIDTRKYLSLAPSTCYNSNVDSTQFGVFRM